MLGSFERLRPRADRLRHVAVSLITVAAVGTAAVQPAAADASPVESASASSLPADGLTADNFNLIKSACGTQFCVTVGSYEFVHRTGGPPYSQSHGLIVSSDDGVASPGVAAPLPQGAAPDSDTNASDGLAAVSCWSAGSCVAVGNYTDSSDNGQAFVLPITDGVPGTPSPVSLPHDAASNPQAQLQDVSCSASGNCVAVGNYDNDVSGDTTSLVVDISDGVPAAGQEVLAPSNANPVEDAGLESVSCQSDGTCSAVGYYYYDATGHLYAGMTVPITNGVAGTVSEVTAMPSNTTGQNWYLSQVSCPPAGTCSAIGYYNSSQRNFVVPVTDGVPGQGAETPPPSGAKNPGSNIGALSCQSSGQCVAIGEYEDTSLQSLPLAVPIADGVPAASEEVTLPMGAAGTGQQAELQGLSCPASGPCLAGGYYKDAASGNYFGMTASFDAGTMASAIQAPAPSDVTSAGASLETVGCAAFSCVAAGDYANASGDAPYVVSAQAPLVIAPTSLPAGAVGKAYSQSVSATGAWGVYNWSVTSGSLPAGLSLNALTGVISGTPTAGGTSSFTLTATGTGLPLQTASQSYSVSITAPPPVVVTPPAAPAASPKLSLDTHTATVRSNRFGLKLSCASAACAGTVKLQITQVVRVRHGKKTKHRRVTVVIASASFSLAAGQATTQTVTLNAAGRRALGTSHHLSASGLDTMSGVNQTLGHLTLKPARVKHKKKH